MAWVKNEENLNSGKRTYWEEATITLPATATTEFSSEIDFVAPNSTFEDRVILIEAVASAVTGTNLDIQWHGALKVGGNKTLLKDTVVPDIDGTPLTGLATLDLNANPGTVFYLSHTSDVNESANTITYRIFIS